MISQEAHENPITLVPYQPIYNVALQELFYHTIHTVNARDYIKEQLQAWAPAQEDPEIWHQRLHGSYALLAFAPEHHLLGFGNVVCPAPASDQALFNSLPQDLIVDIDESLPSTGVKPSGAPFSTANIALLDYLYVNAANQGQHIGTQLCAALEYYLLQHHCSFVLTHASLTAQGFFAQRGYTILKKQQIERSEHLLDNALMGKHLTHLLDPIN